MIHACHLVGLEREVAEPDEDGRIILVVEIDFRLPGEGLVRMRVGDSGGDGIGLAPVVAEITSLPLGFRGLSFYDGYHSPGQ